MGDFLFLSLLIVLGSLIAIDDNPNDCNQEDYAKDYSQNHSSFSEQGTSGLLVILLIKETPGSVGIDVCSEHTRFKVSSTSDNKLGLVFGIAISSFSKVHSKHSFLIAYEDVGISNVGFKPEVI